MTFIKRYPILTSVLILCVVAFGVEAFFFVHYRAISNQAQSALVAAQRNLQNAMRVDIAPTEQNRAAAQANLDELQQDLQQIGQTLQNTSKAIPLPPTGDSAGTDLLVAINAYVQNDMLPLAKERGVVLPDGEFDFGMKEYIGAGAVAPPPDKIPDVFKQMKILDYLLTTLMTDAKLPNQKMKILSVYREDVAAPTKAGTSGGGSTDTSGGQPETFTVSPLVSARKPGFVDTLAFQITFVGYTDSLRLFLNKIKDFELPLVVRSVDVTPASDDDIKSINDADAAATAATATAAAAPASTDSTAKPVAPPAHTPAPKASAGNPSGAPVIKENLSQFTVVIEYIQLHLPKTPEELAAEKAAADAAAAKAATAAAAGTAPTAGTAAPAGSAATASPAPAGTDAAKPADSTAAPKP